MAASSRTSSVGSGKGSRGNTRGQLRIHRPGLHSAAEATGAFASSAVRKRSGRVKALMGTDIVKIRNR